MRCTEPFSTILVLFESPFSAFSNSTNIVKNGSVQRIIRRLIGNASYKPLYRGGPKTGDNASINSTQLLQPQVADYYVLSILLSCYVTLCHAVMVGLGHRVARG